ncbi:hypothetical protein R6Q59_027114 [Mikania micrantha]|uniref:Pectinesterase inhibitor domain-containing protein n=1 Tax=Mikania micrantha TaxID=192012 RepID=A0A5N6MCN5_9ASTR|nr:hypothetical protein E3N88_33674 [Mikania micrantha]
MKFDNYILVIISILFLCFVIFTKGTDFSQSSSNEEEIYDDIKKTFRPALDDANEKLGPVSSLDIDLDEAKEALGPIPSFDEAKEALGPVSSSVLDKAKEALGPISPATLDEAKEALGPAASKAKEILAPISPAALEEAKDVLGPASAKAKEILGPASAKAKEVLGPASAKAKEVLGPASAKAKEVLGPASSNIIDKARDKLDSITSWITQNKEEVTSETHQESDPKEAPGPASAFDPYGILDGAKQKFDSLLDAITHEKIQISQKESGPISSSDEDRSSPSPTSAPAPILPSTFEEAKHAIGSYSSKAIDAAKEKFSSISSYISENKLQISPVSDTKLHSTPVYLDHDVALAVESMIKQAESNSQLAIDEAKTLFSDPLVDSSDTGKCVKECLGHYESCNLKLNKAMEDLKARNVELLTDDIGAAEGEIYACQKCYKDTQSPFNDLEAATIKATRECLNVLDHSA